MRDIFTTALIDVKFGKKAMVEYKEPVGGEIYFAVAGKDGVYLRGEFLLEAL